jgi:uncharacterized protein YjiS (DUF1127 family)
MTTTHPMIGAPALARGVRAPGALTRTLDRVDGWIERYRQRRQLLGLNDALLKDIGISRADVEREAAKPFWRP